jgi:RNA polymerase sigma factor (sigma-70 family)
VKYVITLERLGEVHQGAKRQSCHQPLSTYHEPLTKTATRTMRSPNDKIAAGNFPVTRHSAIIATRSSDKIQRQRAYETLLESYWKPSYKYIRWKWQASNEDSEDLTQEFFARAFEKGYFERYDPTKASFHGFLLVCLDRFIANELKANRRQKRGGDRPHFSLDFESAEKEFRNAPVPQPISPEEYFHREWVRSLFTLVVQSLRELCEAKGKMVHFALFELYDLGDDDTKQSYESLARRFDLKITDVTNHLAFARREFRKLVLARLQELTATDEEFRREARALLGVDPF